MSHVSIGCGVLARNVFTFVIALGIVTSISRAQNSSALINEALDKRVDLSLNDALPEALCKIEGKTAVPIKAEADVWELLPWGDQTTLNATIRNETLRQALIPITRKLGLTFTLGDEAVILQPVPALRRLGKRSTLQELQALDLLATTEMPAVSGVANVRSILTAIDVKLDAMKSLFAIEDLLPPDLRDKPVDMPRNATLMDGLEQIAKQTRATWYPWGKSLVVVPKVTQIRDQLNKSLTVRYNNADILQVLEELRKRAGIDFTIEPGAIQRIPADFRTVRVFWDNVTVAQALESLKGFTGLDYVVTDTGVSITNPTPAVAAAAAPGADPVVAMMTVDNGMQVLVRESELPADVRAYLKSKADAEVESLRKRMKAEAFNPPTTQPTKPH